MKPISRSLLDNIKKTKGQEISVVDAPTYLDAYKSLQEGNASAMVLNSTFEDTIAAEDADYAKKLKKIYSYKIRKEVAATSKVSANAMSLTSMSAGSIPMGR